MISWKWAKVLRKLIISHNVIFKSNLKHPFIQKSGYTIINKLKTDYNILPLPTH